MPYQELTVKKIEKWLGLKKKDVPKHLILYASWPWPLKERMKEVRNYLKKPKPKGLGLSNFWVGEINRKKVGFMLVYGHGMAADMLYLLSKMGVKYIYQIGSIGALQSEARIYDLIIPQTAIKFEGLHKHPIFDKKALHCNKELLELTKKCLEKMDFKNFYIGKTMSIDFIFAETKERVKKWSRLGFLGIDMETATTYSMSNSLGIKTIAILRVSDNLVRKNELMADLNTKGKRGAELKRTVKSIIIELISKLD